MLHQGQQWFCHVPQEKQLGLELGFQETRHSTVGRPDPPMCCNIRLPFGLGKRRIFFPGKKRIGIGGNAGENEIAYKPHNLKYHRRLQKIKTQSNLNLWIRLKIPSTVRFWSRTISFPFLSEYFHHVSFPWPSKSFSLGETGLVFPRENVRGRIQGKGFGRR